MTDTTTQNETPATDSKAKTVLEDMASRTLFNTVDEAIAFIGTAKSEYADFDSYPVITAGFTDEGAFDPAVYTDSMQVAIAKFTEKGNVKEGKPSTVKAIVIYPSPKPEAMLTDPTCQDWLAGVIAKECNLVAMRPLRKAESADEYAEAVGKMPTTIAEYIASNRETTSGIVETYNNLWLVIRQTVGERFKSYKLANLSKKEQRKAMESASYAAAIYPHLETRVNKKGEPESYFEIAIKLGLALAKAEAKDSTIFERMLETRNEKDISIGDDEDGEDWDIDAVAAKLAKADDAAPATTEEGSTEPAPATEPAE